MEPWLAGRFADLAPIPRLLCCSLEQSLADIEKWTSPLTDAQVWSDAGAGSVGFHLRHLAGSVDRLLTYARQGTLSDAQLQFLRAEQQPGATREALLNGVRQAYDGAFRYAATAEQFDEPRYIGRQRLETPHGVLLAHIAEHTQRHTGQLIILAKLAAGR